jgi:hypothetical protein
MKKKISIFLAILLVLFCVANNVAFTRTLKKKTHQVMNANIIIKGEPIFFTGSDGGVASRSTGFVNNGDMMLNNSTITKPDDASVENPQFIKGAPIRFTGDPSSIGTLSGKLTGLGSYDPEITTFSASEGSRALTSGQIDAAIICSQGICSGILQAPIVNNAITRTVGRTALTLSGADSNITINTPYSDGDIDLNGGAITLSCDFKFAAGNCFINDGYVDLNDRTLTFGGLPLIFTNHLFWQNANFIDLNSKVTLRGQWDFRGDSRITGNGNVLDLDGQGTLWIKKNTILYLTNLKLKGLGNGVIVFEDATSQLYLSDVEIELDSDYTMTSGRIYVEGPTTFITKSYTFAVHTATDASMTIDGITLWYDTLGYYDDYHQAIYPVNSGGNQWITLLNGAVVRDVGWFNILDRYAQAEAEITNGLAIQCRNNSNAIVHNSGIYEEHYTVTEDVESIDNMRFIKRGFTVPSGKSLTINTPIQVSGNINLDTDGTLVLNGDLTLASNAYITSGGNFNGNGFSLRFTNSLMITAAGNGLHFIGGNAIVDGGGNVLSFESDGYCYIDTDISVTLRDMIVHLSSSDALQLAAKADLTMQNVIIYLEDNYTFSTGRLFIEDDVILRGNKIFTYSSDKPMYLQKNSMLFFDIGTTFSYAPQESNNRGLVHMVDETAKLYLNGCTVCSTTTGLQLTNGTLVLDNKNNFYADGSTLSSGISLGNGFIENDLNIKIMPGASINIKAGCFDYRNSA